MLFLDILKQSLLKYSRIFLNLSEPILVKIYHMDSVNSMRHDERPVTTIYRMYIFLQTALETFAYF